MAEMTIHKLLAWQRELLVVAAEISADLSNAVVVQEKYQAGEINTAHRRLLRLRGEMLKIPEYKVISNG